MSQPVYAFKPAVREAVPLLLGLIGQSGSGKTFSAMRMASGIVGQGNRFAVIDTESRRALHYADKFRFDHCELSAPFTPDKYSDAIVAAASAGYKAIVVDSTSHEWSGEGGVLDWHENELVKMVENARKKNPNANEYQLRESFNMAAWVKPKMAHKKMVSRLLQVNAHLILCFRAEEKVKMEKDEKGKTHIVPVGLQPICSKEMPYELMASFLLDANKPGYPVPIKLQEQHKIMFPLDALLDEKSGRLISEWASGGAIPQPPKNPVPNQLHHPPEDLTAEREAFALKCSELAMSAKEIADFKKWIFKAPPTKEELKWVLSAFNDWFDAFIESRKG
jgi:hypothetical protein